MALQDPIEPQSNNEPLHKESAVDQSGSIRPWFRNWLERKRLQIGEIISGVNRNAENIVQLQTDFEAADGAISTAYIAADAVVASNAAGARAALQTTIEAAYEAADDALQANINSESSARASADTAIASDVTTLTARVGGAEAGLVKNAYFQEEFSGSAVPPEWTEWNNGLGTWQARAVGEGFAFSFAALGGNEGGIYQDVTVGASKRFLISAEIRRTAGTMAGAGVLVQWFDSGGTQLGFDSIEFESDENLDGVVSATPDGPTRWEKEVISPALSVKARIYAMSHFSTFGSNAVTNSMYWRECSLQLLTNAQAQVRVQGEAIADIEGNLSASYALTVDADGRIAQMRLLADGTTSSVSFAADTFTIFDGASADVAPFQVLGGVVRMQNVEIAGSLLLSGTVDTNELAANAVSNAEEDPFTDFDMTLTDSNWVTPATLAAVDVGGVAILTWNFDFAWTAFGGGGGSQSGDVEIEILRDGTAVVTKSIPYGTDTTVNFGWTGEWEADDFDLVSGTDVVYSVRMRHVRDGAWSPNAPTVETRKVSGNLKVVAFKR